MIYFKLIFVSSVTYRSKFFFSHRDVQFVLAPFVEKTTPSPLNHCSIFVEDQLAIFVCMGLLLASVLSLHIHPFVSTALGFVTEALQ